MLTWSSSRKGSLQGYHVTNWEDTVVDLSGPEVAMLASHCRRLGVWAHFSLLERNPDGGKPYNTSLLIDDRGEVAVRYVKVNPWVPLEELYAGRFLLRLRWPEGLPVGGDHLL